MSATLVSVIRSHVAELDGCSTILLHPDDYDRHWLALCDIGHDLPVVFWRDDGVPRGCYRVEPPFHGQPDATEPEQEFVIEVPR